MSEGFCDPEEIECSIAMRMQQLRNKEIEDNRTVLPAHVGIDPTTPTGRAMSITLESLAAQVDELKRQMREHVHLAHAGPDPLTGVPMKKFTDKPVMPVTDRENVLFGPTAYCPDCGWCVPTETRGNVHYVNRCWRHIVCPKEEAQTAAPQPSLERMSLCGIHKERNLECHMCYPAPGSGWAGDVPVRTYEQEWLEISKERDSLRQQLADQREVTKVALDERDKWIARTDDREKMLRELDEQFTNANKRVDELQARLHQKPFDGANEIMVENIKLRSINIILREFHACFFTYGVRDHLAIWSSIEKIKDHLVMDKWLAAMSEPKP